MPQAKKAHEAIKKATLAAELRRIWTDSEYGYLVLGHKALARMAFLGQLPERAMGLD